ncbi:hypothetical protein D9756_005563 [Leucocoprinus leucothites]|uniref:Uncharacterized protein n=1 Tax=Leucocoprinus leucothites TaxID=201217 RepID=A0A8H5D9A7_9AGAR|nr:hypothetical protein D9756_005563 [Leucoagaricus leucothites]
MGSVHCCGCADRRADQHYFGERVLLPVGPSSCHRSMCGVCLCNIDPTISRDEQMINFRYPRPLDQSIAYFRHPLSDNRKIYSGQSHHQQPLNPRPKDPLRHSTTHKQFPGYPVIDKDNGPAPPWHGKSMPTIPDSSLMSMRIVVSGVVIPRPSPSNPLPYTTQPEKCISSTRIITMDLDLGCTFSTQRFNPMLKRQRSSISAAGQTATSTIRSCHSFVSPRPSVLTIKEPPSDEHRLSRVLSSVSSNRSASRWCEGHSTGVSTLTNTEFSQGLLSRSTSATSFNLSVGECPTSVEDKNGSDGLGLDQPLLESLVSAVQVDAHIPPPASVESHYSEASGGDDGRDDIRGRVRLVSSLSRVVAANQVQVPALTTKQRCASEPLPLSHRFHQVHPEYDSDYDEDTDSAESILSSSSGFAGDETDDDVCIDFRDASVPTRSTPSPTLPRPHSTLLISTPPPASPLPTASSSFQARSPKPIARVTVLSDIYEEELTTAESSPRRQVPSSSSSVPESLLPESPPPLLEEIPVASPVTSMVDGRAWWQIFPRHRRGGSGNNHSEHCDSIIEKIEAEARAENRTPQTPQTHGHHNIASAPIKAGPEPNKEWKLPLAPLPPVPGCIPRSAGRRLRSRTRSGARKVLSVVLPCIPVSEGGKSEARRGIVAECDRRAQG